MSISWGSVGHFFSSCIHDIGVGLNVLEKAAESLAGNPVAQQAVVAVAGAIGGPSAAVIARTGESVLGMAVAAYHAADPAVRDKGLDLHLDASAVAALVPIYKALNPHAPNTQATIAAIVQQVQQATSQAAP